MAEIKAPLSKRWALFFSMINRHEIEIDGNRGVVNTIQAEDGSGKCFNVQLNTSNEWYFVRCGD